MNFKNAIGKTIEKVEVIESYSKNTTYESTPLPELVRELRVRTVRFTFTDGTDDELSLQCD